MTEFEKWWNPLNLTEMAHDTVVKVYAETAWQHQQAKIDRLKRQVEVLRELAIDMKNTQYHKRVNEALAAVEKIGGE